MRRFSTLEKKDWFQNAGKIKKGPGLELGMQVSLVMFGNSRTHPKDCRGEDGLPRWVSRSIGRWWLQSHLAAGAAWWAGPSIYGHASRVYTVDLSTATRRGRISQANNQALCLQHHIRRCPGESMTGQTAPSEPVRLNSNSECKTTYKDAFRVL